jgi:hypothetical protein
MSNLVIGAGATVVRRLADWTAPGPAFTAAQVRGTNNPVWTVRLDAADLANFSETAKTVPVLAAGNGLTGLALSNISLQADDFPGHGTWSLATNSTGVVAVYDPDELTVPAQDLPAAERGSVYNFQFIASGGVSPRDWTVLAGALPAGLQLTSSGLLSGTPSVAGPFAFTAQVTDAAGLTASRGFVLVVAESPLDILSVSLQDAAVGEYHTEMLAATGGTLPYLWSVVAGSLPPGLVLGPDGELAGTPSAAGRFNFTALVADGSGSTVQRGLAINVSAAPGSFEEWSGGVPWPDQASAAKSADPDGDGLSNLLEFAFATDPLAAGAPWPVVDVVDTGAGQTALRLRFRRSATATGLRFTVEATSGLAAFVWEAVAEAEPGGPMTGLSPRILVEEQPLPDGASEVAVTETRMPGEGARFMRLQVAEELP